MDSVKKFFSTSTGKVLALGGILAGGYLLFSNNDLSAVKLVAPAEWNNIRDTEAMNDAIMKFGKESKETMEVLLKEAPILNNF